MASKSLRSDFSEWDALLDRLGGPGREALARRMLVSGGVVVRDEAKAQAPNGVAEEQLIRQYGGSRNPGALENAIYLAKAEKLTSRTVFTYVVSWNSKLAPHGHLAEYGYWQPYVVIFTKDGWFTLKTKTGKEVRRKDGPKRIPGAAFMSAAYEASINRAREAMLARGREELPNILRGEK